MKAIPHFIFFIYLLVILVGNANAQQQLKSRLGNLAKKDISLIVLPSADYSPETGLRLGVFADYYYKLGGKQDSFTKQSITWLEAQYSFKNQLFTQFYTSTFTKNNKYYIGAKLGYINNLERFWGFSYPNTSTRNYGNLEYMKTFLQTKITKRVARNLYAGCNANYTQYTDAHEVKTNQIDEDLLNINAKNIGAGVSVTYDSRNFQASTSSGDYIDVSTSNNYDLLNNKSGFGNLTIDARHFYTKQKYVFANQLYVMHTYNDAPLFDKAKVGGTNILRGYFLGRYRDNNMWCIQSEYRYQVHPMFKIAYFASIGGTSAALPMLFANKLLASNGVGLRLQLNKKKNIYMRFDGAIALDGSAGFYVKMGEAF
jgi:hypothetical protein